VINPTIDFAAIKMMFVIDPLGSPYNTTYNGLAALGGDQTKYKDDTTLNDFLDEVWPSDSTVRLYKGPRSVVSEFASSMDSVQLRYPRLCGDSCLLDGGVPAVWLAQTSFQKYRKSDLSQLANRLFAPYLTNAVPCSA
jgi:hypothetical protein